MLTDNKKKIEKIISDYGNRVVNPKEPDGFEKATNQIRALCESIRAEALKEVEGIIGNGDNDLINHTITWNTARNELRMEQRAVLAKLSKEDDEEEICICGQDDPTANGMRMDIICPKHDET
jgi:hypothetical protein